MNLTGMIPMMLITQAINFGDDVHLPEPRVTGAVPLEESIAKRRSVREFTSEPLAVDQVGQLLWAAQSVTEKHKGLRSVPSAGALYPLEIYVVLPAGIYRYQPSGHGLKRIKAGDSRAELQKAAHDQEAVGAAPAVFVIAAVYDRTEAKYGDRAARYISMEAGHACQNLSLQATALGLAGVPVGSFDDRQVAEAVKLSEDERPLYLVPLGHPAE